MAGQFLTQTLLEFSEDDLNDATPTWVDVTMDCQGIEWWAGIDSEGDDPQPGGAVIRMRNRDRRWEPDFVAGQFYPNIVYGRRFRLTLDDAVGAAVQEGLWYITNIQIEYPAGTGYSEVVFTCADGFEVLALDDLPQLDPPDAQSYPDVVAYDEPLAYFRLSDPPGTQAKPVMRQVTRGKGKHRRKIRVRRGERVVPPVLAGSGNEGVYVDPSNLSRWQEEGVILGDADTGFDPGVGTWAQASVDRTAFYQVNAVSVEVWVRWGTGGVFAAGPWRAASGRSIFSLGTASPAFRVDVAGGVVDANYVSSPSVGDIVHLVGTWNGQAARIFFNGVEEAATLTPDVMRQGDADEFVYPVGNGGHSGVANVGVLDEVAFYEYALPPERVMAHYIAGSARGFPRQTAGERIAEIATHALWSEAGIQTSGRDVMPQMMAGQSRLEEIAELAHAEGPRTMFFFNGNGDPVYLGHEWQASSSSYNTTQVTLGDHPGEVAYEAIEPVYDNEVYNEVTVSHESGLAATVGTGTPPPRRANTDYTDVLLMEHAEVESLANAILAFYEDPQMRFESVTLNGATADCLNHILRRDIGHQVRVKKSGESGARIDRIANIIGKRKQLTKDKHLTCTWSLGRGFNAADGFWHAGIVGDSEAGTTTVAA